MSLLNGLVDGVVSHYKKKKQKPAKTNYTYLLNDPLLNDSSYLDWLADHAKTKGEIDCIHEHLNKFNDRVDVYEVPSYMKLSQKLIDKRGNWQ